MEKNPEEVDKEQLQRDLKENNLELVVHLPFRQPLATTVEEFNQAQRKYLGRMIEFSSELGAEKAVVHPNLRFGQDKGEVRETVKEQMQEINKLGERNGVEICFENIPFEESKTADLMEFGEIIDELGLSMCFDNGHAFAETGEDEIKEFLEKYSRLVSHLHVQDTREGEDLHIPVGSGEFDFEILGEHFQGFDGTACLEVYTGDRDYQKLSSEKLLEHF